MRNLLRRLLSLDADSVGEGSLRFADPWPGLVTILVVAALIALFRYLYNTERSRASRGYRTVLTWLRCSAAFLIIFMLFRPVLLTERTEERESHVVLLLDSSLSMSLCDHYADRETRRRIRELADLETGGTAQSWDGTSPYRPDAVVETLSRAELVNRILNSERLSLINKLGLNAKLRVHTFSEDLSPALGLPSGEVRRESLEPDGETDPKGTPATLLDPDGLLIVPDGATTRLGDAIATAAGELRGQHIAGLIVISDGQSNSGRPPEEAVEDSAVRRVPPFPVLTVGVGSPEPPRDIEIVQVLANDAAFVNDEVLFSVLVRANGFGGEDAVLLLEQEGEPVKEVPVQLPEDGASKEVRLRYSPRTVGQFTYEISIPPGEGEAVSDNNSQTHLMKVVDDLVRVLYVAGQPSWEYRYLKNALMRDHAVEVSCLLQSADPDFIQEGNRPIQRFPTTRKELFQFDVLLFADVDFSLFSETQYQAIVDFVDNLGGGLLIGAGPRHGLRSLRGTSVTRLLPVVLAEDDGRRAGPATEPFRIRLTPEGAQHSVLRMEGDSRQNDELWKQLSPFYWHLPVKEPKPGALVLAEHPFERNEAGNHVILAAQMYGAGRAVYLGTNSTWRWRYYQGDFYFYRFWGQTIRFLSAGRLLGHNKRINIVTDRNSYQLGDEVRVTARLRDELYRPLELPEVVAAAREPGGNSEDLVLVPVVRRPGTYRGTYQPQSAGAHEVLIERVGELSATARSFMVEEPALETERPEANQALLQRLAQLSDGEYIPLEDIERVPDKIAKFQENMVIEVEDDLWDSPLMLLLFSAILITEWILRKKRMMI